MSTTIIPDPWYLARGVRVWWLTREVSRGDEVAKYTVHIRGGHSRRRHDGVGGGEGCAGGPLAQDVPVEGHEAGIAAIA
jgi:hypothetical protein